MTDLSKLTADQRALLETLLREQGADPAVMLPLGKRPEPQWAPLSFAQQRMWFAYRQAPQDSSYNIQMALRIDGPLAHTELARALEQLSTRHETLRTSFEEDAQGVRQRIYPPGAPELVSLEIDQPDALVAFVSAEALRPWTLEDPRSIRTTLIRTGPQTHVLLLGMHHILCDAWSLTNLARDLWSLYGAHDSAPTDLAPLTVSYGDFAYWEQQTAAASLQEQAAYWRSALVDAPDVLNLPLDRPRHASETTQASIYNWSLTPSSASAIEQLSQQLRCSTFSVCLAGFYVLLYELTAQRDLLVATPVANRSRAELEPLVGYFANTVVMRGQFSGSTTFGELVQRIHEQSLDVLANQSFPFERIIEEINPRRIAGIAPLTQVFFAFQQQGAGAMRVHELEISPYEHGSRSTRFDLEAHMWQTSTGGIDATLIYPDLFESDTVKRWAQRLTDILHTACTASHHAIGELTKPTALAPENLSAKAIGGKLTQLLQNSPHIKALAIDTDWRAAQPTAYLAPQSLYDTSLAAPVRARLAQTGVTETDQDAQPALIEGPSAIDPSEPELEHLSQLLAYAAQHHPDSGCVFIGQDTRLTYPELQDVARKRACALSQCGVGQGDIVLFQLSSEQAVIEHFWGAVLIGAVPLIQLPTDPAKAQMHEQLMAVWQALGQPHVLVSQDTAAGWAQTDADLIWIETLEHANDTAMQSVEPIERHQIAFMSLSSGTSGRPKAIALSHHNLLRRAFAAKALTGIDARRIMLNWQPLNHIASISDWHIRGMAAGATLIYGPTAPVLAQPLRWLDWIEQYRVTDSWAPNFAYTRVLEALKQAQDRPTEWDLSSLKLCLSAGESIVPAILDQFEDELAHCGLPRGVLQPAFGMAETASGTTYHCPQVGTRVPRYRPAGQHRDFVGLGTPIRNIAVRVVDENGALARCNQIGRVQFKGDAVFAGYYQEPALNKTIFTDDGWFESGDLGFIHDQSLYVTGREKAEIVVRGQNISCESVEITLSQLDEVSSGDVAVCSVSGSPDQPEQSAIFFSPAQWPVEPQTLKKIRGVIVQQFGFVPDHLLAVKADVIARTSLGKVRRHVLSNLFNEGHFDELVRQMAAQEAIIADSFFRKVWRRAPLAGYCSAAEPIYILSEATTLATDLLARLTDDGQRAQIVSDLAASLPDRFHLIDLRLINNDLARSDSDRAQWAFGSVRTSLCELAKQKPQACWLTVVTRLAQVTQRQTARRASDAVITGLLKSAAFEYAPWLQCRHLDIDDSPIAEQVDVLHEELGAQPFEPEVVYRQARRLVPEIRRVKLNKGQANAKRPFDPSRFIVISGGLGGIGRVLATILRQTFGAHVLLLGRSDPDDAARAFIQADQGLSYVAVDVSDAQGVARAIDEHQAKWQQPLGAVIHLAGTGNWRERLQDYNAHLIAELDERSTRAQFQAKIAGTEVLFDAARSRPGVMFIAASSVLGEFGGPGFSVYAAANAFLTTFCRAQRQAGYNDIYCTSWPSWLDTGMSIGLQAGQSSSAGYIDLTADAGWHVFLASLLSQQHDLIVGLAPNHPSQRTKPSLLVRYTTDDPQAADRYMDAVAALPWLQTHVDLRIEHVDSLTADHAKPGKNDRAALASGLGLPYHAALRAILQDLLRIEHIEPDDNFFELGAHSLLMVTFESRIKQSVCEKVELLDLFRYPSISRLARHIDRLNSQQSEPVATVGHAQQRTSSLQNQAKQRQARLAHRKARS